MRIAVDAMGGDRAPEAVVAGAADASSLPGFEIILVGRRAAIEPLLARHARKGAIRIVDAPDVIEMGEQPVLAVRRKKQASLVVCGDLVKNGEADAFVSAGNTGAGMVVAKQKWKAIPGIDRPAIAAILPSSKGKVVMLDAGANVDCSPLNLQQFAVMGSIYAEQVLHIRHPRVGLLNIGEEESKGNELARETYGVLRGTAVNFVGNVEGRDIFAGAADVVVCDGFAGNVVLKVGEGVAEFLKEQVKAEVRARLWPVIPALMLSPVLSGIERRANYEEVGGAPLLGVNGICIISHGRSTARAITNAIRTAGEAVKHGVVDKIGREIGSERPAPALV